MYFFHHRSVHVAVGDVLVDVEQIVACAAKRPVVLVVPVLELHAVDVAAVEVGHLVFDYTVGEFRTVEGGHEAVAGETCPVARHVNGYGSENGLAVVLFLTVHFSHVAGEIGTGGCPCP